MRNIVIIGYYIYNVTDPFYLQIQTNPCHHTRCDILILQGVIVFGTISVLEPI